MAHKMLPVLTAAGGVCNGLVFSHAPLREISTPAELFSSEEAIQFVSPKNKLLFFFFNTKMTFQKPYQ